MMANVTEQQVKDAIQAFLTTQYDVEKRKRAKRNLPKPFEDNDVAKNC